MKRLLPQSLFGRLFLVLTVGLILAQTISAAINLRERTRIEERGFALRVAQRAADNIQILEILRPGKRQQAAEILSTKHWHIHLGPAAPTKPGNARRDSDNPWFRTLTTTVNLLLGDRHNVIVTALAPRRQTGLMLLSGIHGGHLAPPPPARIEASLADGTWVTIEWGTPFRVHAWPVQLILKLLILLAGILFLAFLAVTWLTRPLATLANAALGLGHDIHRPPLPEKGPTEVRKAARAFNTMQAQLVQYIDSRLQLFTAISHDLKTPITRLRLRAELLEDEDLREKVAQDVAELEGMVLATLDFLRGADSHEGRHPVDVNALLQALQQDAEDVGRAVTVSGSAKAHFTGQPQALRRCLSNLIENAIRYGGRASITVADDARELTIRIHDAGPGIPENQLERVFEPFYRLERSRARSTGGSGLGLAIARNIARAHGGDVTLRNDPEGGLEATLRLPRR